MARCIKECGAETFIDVNDIAAGDDLKRRIREEIARTDELVVLFTAWSSQRSWLWVEIGAAWILEKRVVAILYEVSRGHLENDGGRAVLEGLNFCELNEFDIYLQELSRRIVHV